METPSMLHFVSDNTITIMIGIFHHSGSFEAFNSNHLLKNKKT
jgi:hypothetical protein